MRLCTALYDRYDKPLSWASTPHQIRISVWPAASDVRATARSAAIWIPPMECMNTEDLAVCIRASLLASEGWLSSPLSPSLDSLYAALLSAFSSYFALPPDAPDKTKCAVPLALTGASDVGFAVLLGEKGLITIRRAGLAGTPAPLRDATEAAWALTGAMHDIAEGLKLPELDAFDEMSKEARDT